MSAKKTKMNEEFVKERKNELQRWFDNIVTNKVALFKQGNCH